MDKVRRFLWKYLGVTLSWETFFIVGAVLLSCIAVFVLGFVPAFSSNRILRVLCYLATIPGVIIVLGSCYRPLSWGLSNKKERERIEREVALGQLKKRVKIAQATKKRNMNLEGK